MAAVKKHSDRILLTSRWDFLGSGFRKGLLDLMAKTAREDEVDFVVLCGGLIYHKGWRELKYKKTHVAIEAQKAFKAEEMAARTMAHEAGEDRPPESVETQKQVRERVREEAIEEAAQALADAVPVVKDNNGKPIKIYITTSPARNYDGPEGYEIAQRLEELRSDIFLWDEDSGRFPLKNSGKVVWVVNPVKASWRSKYYSTSADRIVEDKEMQSSQDQPDLWVIGTGASAINSPQGGEDETQRITVPALHRLQERHTSENQVGVTVVELFRDRSFHNVKVYNFKDLLRDERSFIPKPENATERQEAILEQIRREPSTIGMLEDALPWKRGTIQRDIGKYNEAGLQPAIVLGEGSKYNVDPNWLQFKMRYSFPSASKLKKYSILEFACLHIGYKATQYAWFIRRLPELIREHEVDALLDVGDNIAGLKHNLDRRGELYAALKTYTQQEELAGEEVGKVTLEAFKSRFDEWLSSQKGTISKRKLIIAVDTILLELYIKLGNHDDWVTDLGFVPLATMRKALLSYVTEGVVEHLAKRGLFLPRVGDIVKKHVHFGPEHTLSTGVTMSLRHPYQGRMQTSSGRAQQTLKRTKGQLVGVANFHEGEAVHEWKSGQGQRLAVQVGTIVDNTQFESNMNKLVDTGVAVAKIYSDSETNRIYVTEVIWDSPAPEEIVHLPSDDDLIDELKKKLGI